MKNTRLRSPGARSASASASSIAGGWAVAQFVLKASVVSCSAATPPSPRRTSSRSARRTATTARRSSACRRCRRRMAPRPARARAARAVRAVRAVAREVHQQVAVRALLQVAVALVLGPVEREHARADHLPGREARVVDRERGGVAHHLHSQVAPGDEPAVQYGHPRHRLGLAQAREQRVRVRLELVQGDLQHRPDLSPGSTDDPWMCRRRGPSQSRSAAVPRGGPLGSRPIGSGERPRRRHAAGIGRPGLRAGTVSA